MARGTAGRQPTPLKALAARLGIRKVDIASIAGVSMDTVGQLYNEMWSPRMRIGTLVQVAYALGVSPLELLPGLEHRPAGGPVRLGSDAAVKAVLHGERLEVVRARDPALARVDRLPAPGEMRRTMPPVFDVPAEEERT